MDGQAACFAAYHQPGTVDPGGGGRGPAVPRGAAEAEFPADHQHLREDASERLGLVVAKARDRAVGGSLCNVANRTQPSVFSRRAISLALNTPTGTL